MERREQDQLHQEPDTQGWGRKRQGKWLLLDICEEESCLKNKSLFQIHNEKVEFKVGSRIGSLANVKHRPGGGDKKIFDDKEYIR